MTAVLDASAVIALVRNEPGADRVEPILHGALVSAVNWAEVFSHFTHYGWAHARAEEAFSVLPVTIVPVDRLLAEEAGAMWTLGRAVGLSLADRLCLALARREGASAYTADRAWRTVADAVGVEVVTIR